MQRAAEDIDVFQIERTVWIAEAKVDLAVYDFDFGLLMDCRHGRIGVEEVTAIGRFGAVEDYDKLHAELIDLGVRLVHSPEQHRLCSDLPQWYALLEGMTPESWWFDKAPDAKTAGNLAGWPLFLKGSRQTSRHKASLSIIHDEAEYDAAIASFATDHLLHWQQIVIRRFEKLRRVEADMGQKIPASFEFRSFWWHGELAGAGPYFSEFARYDWNDAERAEALELAQEAARRVALPFVVIDLAQRSDGKWIVIEINDAQECGYTGVKPLPLWQRMVALESGRVGLQALA
jgi:hypothetical protein